MSKPAATTVLERPAVAVPLLPGTILGDALRNWAIIRFAPGAAGERRGLRLAPGAALEVGDRISLIHHPQSNPKRMSLDAAVTYVDESVVRYIAETAPGSAGAPVFNSHWEVVALHSRRAGTNDDEKEASHIAHAVHGMRAKRVSLEGDLPPRKPHSSVERGACLVSPSAMAEVLAIRAALDYRGSAMRMRRSPLPLALFAPWLLGALLLPACSSTPPVADPPAKAVPPAVTAAAPAPAVTASASAEPAPPPAEPPAPPSKWAACEAPPVGMACVPGGPAVIGSNDHEAREKPQHTVEVSTFYLDRHEVTNAEYEKCEKAKACPPRILPDRTFLSPDQPAVPVTWHGARAYCQWAGKRLPTEAEWEKAARGGDDRIYPWGNEPATCDRAQTEGCAPSTTKPVGSFAPGPYGIFDMAGNGYEWTNDWESACYSGCQEACGAGCAGEDPWGPCGGAPVCKGHKAHVLKGGSWRWAAKEARGAWRRFEEPNTGAHRLSARCASSAPSLSTWPPLALSDPPPAPGDPEPLADEAAAKLRSVVEDTDVLKIPACDRPGGSTTTCRDPNSYLTTNEPELHLWEPFVRNVGGGYVGIGADQSYSLIAAARSRYAWLFDYDPMVVKLHHLLRALILASPTAGDFVEAFAPKNAQTTREAVAAHAAPGEKEGALRVLLQARELLHEDYSKRRKTAAGPKKSYDWLANEESYRYIRLLYQQGRILPLKGNLLTDRILPSIARSARSLGAVVRVFYTSNADDQWRLSPQFRANVIGLPFDERSVWLRTVYPREKERTRVLPWEYVVHAGLDAQRRLSHEGWDWVWYFNKDARRVGPDNLLAVALPARTERERPVQNTP